MSGVCVKYKSDTANPCLSATLGVTEHSDTSFSLSLSLSKIQTYIHMLPLNVQYISESMTFLSLGLLSSGLSGVKVPHGLAEWNPSVYTFIYQCEYILSPAFF